MLNRITRGMSLGLAVGILGLTAASAQAADPEENAKAIAALESKLDRLTAAIDRLSSDVPQELPAETEVQRVAAFYPPPGGPGGPGPAAGGRRGGRGAGGPSHGGPSHGGHKPGHGYSAAGTRFNKVMQDIFHEYEKAEEKRKVACALKELLKCADDCVDLDCDKKKAKCETTSYYPAYYVPTYSKKWSLFD